MTFRFLKITSFYDTYLRDFYRRRPGLEDLDYEEQRGILLDDCFGWANFYAVRLRELGHETVEVVSNAEPLQRRWALENGIPLTRRWREEVVVAQIAALKPDVLFWEDHVWWSGRFHGVRSFGGFSPRLQCAYVCSATEQLADFVALDAVFTCCPDRRLALERLGAKAYVLRHGFEHSLLDRLEPAAPVIPLTFAGSLSGAPYHRPRVELFDRLMRATPLEVWVAEPASGIRQRLGRIARRCLGTRSADTVRGLRKRHPDRFHPAIFGKDMFRLLARSSLSLNQDGFSQRAVNMRHFEATGMGSVLVTEHKDDLGELFDTEREVVTYRTPEECVEKVRYLLSHESERAAIAAAGQARTLRDHRLEDRAKSLANDLEERLRAL